MIFVKKLKDISIRRKLMVFILGSSTIALLTLGSIIITYNVKGHKIDAEREITLLGKMFSEDIQTPLSFNDKNAINEKLLRLATYHSIENAIVFDVKKNIFSTYGKVNNKSLKLKEFSTQCYYLNNCLKKITNIKLNGEIIGHLLLSMELNRLNQKDMNIIFTILGLILISFIVVYVVATKLRQLITTPINELLFVMDNVAENKNYQQHITDDRKDELGKLIRHFNSMLDDLDQKHNALEEANSNLEEKVRKRTEELHLKSEELKETANIAIAANNAKSSFLANMSHEIRTPMHGVYGLTALLLNTELSHKQKHYVKGIDSSSDHLMFIINSILDLSKIESGKFELHQEPFEIKALLNEINYLYEHTANEKNLNFSVFCDPNISNYHIGDASRIKQILMNLIVNSIKFTEVGSVELNISLINNHDKTDEILFAIKDTGIGIDTKKIDKLFGAFEQGDSSTTKKYGGTGLGLTISKNLVNMMGGVICIESNLNKGSEFSFKLLLEQSDISQYKLKHIKRNKESFKMVRNKKILLVEDQEINMTIIEENLKHFGFKNLIKAFNGRMALDKLEENKDIKLIFMDCQMPIMDGFQATCEIRKNSNSKEVIIVAMTANAMLDDRQNCTNAGMNDYLSKPYKLEDLEEKLAKYLLVPGNVKESDVFKRDDTLSRKNEWLDFDKGLDYIGGKEQLYIELLEDFLIQIENICNELDTSAKDNDLNDMLEKTYNLKDSASNIKANEIAEFAEKFSKMINKNNEINTEILLTELQTLQNIINNTYDEIMRQFKEKKHSTQIIFTKKNINVKQEIAKLKTLLKNRDKKSLTLFDSIKPNMIEKLDKEKMLKLEETILALKYDKALEIICENL